MTICIAAICQKGASAVVCADRQVTVPSLNLEVERAKSKMVEFAPGRVAMSAGDALAADEICLQTKAKLAPLKDCDVVATAKASLDSYIQFRQDIAEQRYLRPIGYDWPRFHEYGQRQMPPQIYMSVLQQLGSLDLGCDLLLAGFIGDKARMASISSPGMLRWVDGMEFYAIGSGAQHAITSILLAGYSTCWDESRAVAEVYAAKRNAERAPGVGNVTDLKVIKPASTRTVDAATMTRLDAWFSKLSDDAKNQKNSDKIEVGYDVS
jgi:hypothetical protein